MDNHLHLHSNTIDQSAVLQAIKHMPTENHLYALAEIYKVFGDLTRVKILHALLDAPLCVSDIAHLTEMTPSSISHQLRILKQAHLVRYLKKGKVVYYSIHDDHVRNIINVGLEHVKE